MAKAKARRRATGGSIPVADGFFLLRTPLLPAATLARFAAEGGIPVEVDDPTSSRFAGWLAEQRAHERAALAAIVCRADVREALFVASPSLFASVEVWQTAPDSRRGRVVEAALFRYVERMSARPTPFGLFAGTTLGTTGDRTVLALGPRSGYRRHTRLDYDTLERLTAALADDPALGPHLAFVANSSIYRVADRVRFVESVRSEWGRSYVLSAVDAIPRPRWRPPGAASRRTRWPRRSPATTRTSPPPTRSTSSPSWSTLASWSRD
jgi:hypothetical protein